MQHPTQQRRSYYLCFDVRDELWPGSQMARDLPGWTAADYRARLFEIARESATAPHSLRIPAGDSPSGAEEHVAAARLWVEEREPGILHVFAVEVDPPDTRAGGTEDNE